MYRQEREEIMDKRYYGEFGGQFVSESLMNTLDTLEKEFETAIKDPEFIKDYNYYLKAGRIHYILQKS